MGLHWDLGYISISYHHTSYWPENGKCNICNTYEFPHPIFPWSSPISLDQFESIDLLKESCEAPEPANRKTFFNLLNAFGNTQLLLRLSRKLIGFFFCKLYELFQLEIKVGVMLIYYQQKNTYFNFFVDIFKSASSFQSRLLNPVFFLSSSDFLE